MANNRILVLGGTGTIGRVVVRRLTDEGFTVRVLTRDPERAAALFGAACEIAPGDVEDLDALNTALAGCVGVHLSLDGGADPDLERRAAETVTRLATTHGVTCLTLLSGASVRAENDWFPGTAAKLAAENAVVGSGIRYAIFRASFFMESLPRYVQGNRASVIGKQPGKWHWVAGEDFAAMVAQTHRTTVPWGIYPVLGPEAFTLTEALQVYCARVNPAVTVRRMPLWLATMMAKLPAGAGLRGVLPFLRYTEVATESLGAGTTPQVFGAPATTLELWCNGQVNLSATTGSVSSGHGDQA